MGFDQNVLEFGRTHMYLSTNKPVAWLFHFSCFPCNKSKKYWQLTIRLCCRYVYPHHVVQHFIISIWLMHNLELSKGPLSMFEQFEFPRLVLPYKTISANDTVFQWTYFRHDLIFFPLWNRHLKPLYWRPKWQAEQQPCLYNPYMYLLVWLPILERDYCNPSLSRRSQP